MFESDDSLPPILRNEGITWLSPYQISDGNFDLCPHTTDDVGPKTEDVLEGFHGAFFLSGIISLINTNDEQVRNFKTYPRRRNGSLEYAFYKKDGTTERVRINDLLPTRNGKLVFAQAPNNRFWCPLLEKAYAKFLGGYQYLALGMMRNIVYPLTGNSMDIHNINEFENVHLLIWIQTECRKNHPIVCKTKHSFGNNGDYGRGFAVIGVTSSNNEDLICIRNPKKPTLETIRVEDFKRDFDLIATSGQYVSHLIRIAPEYDDWGRNTQYEGASL